MNQIFSNMPEFMKRNKNYILAIAIVGGMFFAWSNHGLNASQDPATEIEQSASEAEQSKEQAPQPAKYTIANDDFSNLQHYDVTIPVYDRYTLSERYANGLPTALPENIVPYAGEKIAYLTFDDGPDNQNTPAVLDILKAYGVPATFYVTGIMVEANPDVLKRIFDEGHAIGNHSYDHDYYRLYSSPDAFIDEMMQTEELIRQVIGVRPLIVRAPGGTMGMFDETFPPALKANGYVEHDWNVSTEDATPIHPSAEMEIQFVDSQTADGVKDDAAIILMHSIGGKEETVRALPGIIELMVARGYRFGVVTPMTPQPW